MSNSAAPGNASPATEDIYGRLAAQQPKLGNAVFGVAAALAAIPIVNVALYRWDSRLVFIWGVALTVFAFGVGLWNLLAQTGDNVRERGDRLRLMVLIVLGGVGLLTALLGLLLPFSSSPYSVTDYSEIFRGGVAKWRERANAWALARCGAALLGGLILMFLGLLQARAFERTNPSLRRILYGYNAVLTSLLLILIVVLINLLPYSGVRPFSYAKEPVDWTRTGVHTLHPATKNVLAKLAQPVKVYVLGSSGERVMFEMGSLLEKCRDIDPQLNWEQLSRDRNRGAMQELIDRYQIPDSEGVLVVYGTSPNTVHDFIKASDLSEMKMGAEPGQRFVFKGESALLNSLTFLASGKSKAVVYFTQGSGELDFKSTAANQLDVGIGTLVEDLNRVNYQTRELTVTPDSDQIPDDADIVVVARPREEMPAKFVSALRDYLKGTKRKDNKKGKLMVLFDVVQRGGKGPMARTGLEALVAEYGVRVGDNRLLNPSRPREPLRVEVIANPLSKNPIAQAFSNEAEGWTPFLFYAARTVEPVAANPRNPTPAPAETLIIAHPTRRYLIDTDLNASPTALVTELLRMPVEQARPKLTEQPPSLAVTVTEGKAAAPIPNHEFLGKEGQPRMIVFGDASWISNLLEQQIAPSHFNLFASCLSWLAERGDIGERLPPTQHDLYRIKAAPGSEWRIVVLPSVLMIVGALALGVGVWVVRRR
jgi:hypothetical protein